MDCVEFCFGKIYEDGADLEVERITKILDNLALEYQRKGDGMNTEELRLNLIVMWKNMNMLKLRKQRERRM